MQKIYPRTNPAPIENSNANREFARQDAVHLRREPENATQGVSRHEPEGKTQILRDVNPLIQRVAAVSLSPLQNVMSELQKLHDFLHNEGERIGLSYRRARLFAAMLLLSLAALLLAPIYSQSQVGNSLAAISFLSLIVACIGTSSSIFLGWRADRRQSEELRLEIEQLELQLSEALKAARRNPAGHSEYPHANNISRTGAAVCGEAPPAYRPR
jgi:hypothetical protein